MSDGNTDGFHDSDDESMKSLRALEGVLLQLRNTFIDFAPPTISSSVPRAATMPNIAGLLGGEDSDISPRSSDLFISEFTRSFDPHMFRSFVNQEADTTVETTESPPLLETTVMLRNLPNKMTQMDIVNCLHDKGFKGTFDFFYAPLDFKSKCNLGYAFINCISHEEATRLWHTLKGQRLVNPAIVSGPALKSTKTCEVSWARIQGLTANVKHYQSSPVNELSNEFRPMLVDPLTSTFTCFPTPAKISTPTIKPQHREPLKPIKGKPACKLFCGGLAPETTSETLSNYMQTFGPVEEATVMTKRDTGVSRGFGFCTFRDDTAAARALAAKHHWLDGVAVAVRGYTSTSNR